jgi:hypothetical protein
MFSYSVFKAADGWMWAAKKDGQVVAAGWESLRSRAIALALAAVSDYSAGEREAAYQPA